MVSVLVRLVLTAYMLVFVRAGMLVDLSIVIVMQVLIDAGIVVLLVHGVVVRVAVNVFAVDEDDRAVGNVRVVIVMPGKVQRGKDLHAETPDDAGSDRVELPPRVHRARAHTPVGDYILLALAAAITRGVEGREVLESAPRVRR